MRLIDHFNPHGFTVTKRQSAEVRLRTRAGHISWKAAYGLYLIRGCQMADRESQACGRFVPFNPMTEEQFLALRRARMNPAGVRWS